MMDVENGSNTVSPATTRHEEYQYLDLVRRVIDEGDIRPDRTGVGTRSIFGAQMRFSLQDAAGDAIVPLLTTKRVFWRGVVEELLWIARGNTRATALDEQGVRIWNANATREFLDGRGLNRYPEGILGPVYGFQWRHFGADYHIPTAGQVSIEGEDVFGIDQLTECARLIREDPYSRRIVLSAWNPPQLAEMALPPCHVLTQFYVSRGNRLSCQMYQRSADLGLGVPFNIASYSLLTHLMAHWTGTVAHEFIHTIGDAHVYLNHVDALREQINREPRAFPRIAITAAARTPIYHMSSISIDIKGYNPHATVKMDMAV